MKYSILKEDTPQNTVKRIKNILNNLKIDTKETYFPSNIIQTKENFKKVPTISVRLEMCNPYLGGVNGKGTSIDNAKASAYAEFMERLQNFVLFDSPWLVGWAKDRYKPKQQINYNHKQLNKYFQKKINSNVCQTYKDINNLIFLPFYNIKDKKTYNLPYDIILFLQGSNGMAAGNTIKEATVQGLSEICERYAIKKIFTEKISLPSIPEEEYIKYGNIKKALEYYKQNGYNVHIKDASLGGKIPVVCTIFEKDNIYNFVFGAQPSLPISIERTLTEYAQGNNINEHIQNIQNLPYYSEVKFNEAPIEHIIRSMFYTRVSFEKNSLTEKCFFNKSSSYKYNKEAWIQSKNNITNDDVLNFLIEKLDCITSNIFIRDVSFLGFPSIYIFIPNISEIAQWDKKSYENLINFQNWLEYSNNKNNKELYNIKTLLQLTDYYMTLQIYYAQCQNLFDAPLEYIAFLCSIVIKNAKKVEKYKNIILAQNKIYDEYTEEQLLMIEIINEYFQLSKISTNKELIKEQLLKKYKESDVIENLEVIEKLTYETILSIALKKQKRIKISKKRVENRILKIYKKNCPNQMDLKQHFEKYGV